MDFTTASIKSNNSSTDFKENNVPAKLRRLKIQEGLLLQNIKKDISNHCTDENRYFESCLEFKKYINNIKTSYTTLKNLLHDVITATQSDEILQSTDLDDIKKDILQLDEKLKSYKMFLQNEQAFLKQQEQYIIKEINDSTNQNNKIKVIKGVSTKFYSDIIPSPVKNIINAPLKCQEVQNFQDFLSVTNKCGGWDEYHHNIFIFLWKKYIKEDTIDTAVETYSLDDFMFKRLTDEFLTKAPGFRRADVNSHIKWYLQYLYLKACQQRALNEWRAKTKPLKAPSRIEDKKQCRKYDRENCSCKQNLSADLRKPGRRKTSINSNESKAGPSKEKEQEFFDCVNTNEYFKQINNSLAATGVLNKNETLSYSFAKPTKQWDMKCNSLKDPKLQAHSIEHVTKLGIPTWRLGLQEY